MFECTKFDPIMEIIDIDHSGTISWEKIAINANERRILPFVFAKLQQEMEHSISQKVIEKW